jgi:hypothetical protein
VDYNFDNTIDILEERNAGLQTENFHSRNDEGYFYIFSDRWEEVQISFLNPNDKSLVYRLGTFLTNIDKYLIIKNINSLLPGEYIVQFLFFDSKIDCSYYFFWNIPLRKVNRFIIFRPKVIKD